MHTIAKLIVLSVFLPLIGYIEIASAETSKPHLTKNTSTVYDVALHDELVAMVKPDQAVRQKRVSEMTPADFELMHQADIRHEQRMREIIEKVGWPGWKLVGEDGSQDAWLIVQHCSLEFEQVCLPLLENAVKKGDASAMNYAYLLDRVLMYEGKPQVYGTQFSSGRLYPIEDPMHVDERRKSVGLGPEAEYVEKLKKLQ